MPTDEASNERLEAAARRLLSDIAATGVDRAVVEAMARVPRHVFVPVTARDAAYKNVPLPP